MGAEEGTLGDAKGLLFLCVANSARSQMAEGIARALVPDGVEVYSAGSAPQRVNAHAVAVLAECGIDISSHRSKSLDEVSFERVDTVVTLCAEEVCPVHLHEVRRFHWPLADPAAASGSDEDVAAAFRATRDDLHRRLTAFLA